MMEFWLISVPLDKVSCQSLETLKQFEAKTGLTTSSRLQIPELKVGTLDVLLGVSDDLSRLDSYAEGVIHQTVQCLGEVMEDFSGKLLESMLANKVDLATYLTKFQWDRAKYPPAQPLKTLTDIITKQVSQVDTELKSRRAAYSHVKAQFQNIEWKTEGGLDTHMLINIVRKEDLVLNSEYLTTLLVVVPRKLVEDANSGIFTVTLFKNSVTEFKVKANKQKFTVREYNPDEAEKQKQEMGCLAVDRKEHCRTFMCWLKVNFSEIFVAWIHVKVLRTFVESVLRYGLPVSFQSVLLQPNKKSVMHLRQQLNCLFKHLDPAATAKVDVDLDIPDVSTGQQEYYSYICYPIQFKMLELS